MERIDPEAEAVREERQTAALVEHGQIVPECRIIAERQISLPGRVTLIDQLRHFPKADHDDGPDALQMLWMAATTMGASASGFQSIGRHGAHDDSGGFASRRMF